MKITHNYYNTYSSIWPTSRFSQAKCCKFLSSCKL